MEGDRLDTIFSHLSQGLPCILEVDPVFKLFQKPQIPYWDDHDHILSPPLQNDPLASIDHTIDDGGETLTDFPGCDSFQERLSPSHSCGAPYAQ